MEFKEMMIEQELAHCGDHVCLELEYERVALGAEVYPAVVKAGVDGGIGFDGKRVRDRFYVHGCGEYLNAAELYIIVGNGFAFDGNYRVDGELIHDSGHLGALFFFKSDLYLAAYVADNKKSHRAFVAQIFNKSLNFHLAAGSHSIYVGAFHFNTIPFKRVKCNSNLFNIL